MPTWVWDSKDILTYKWVIIKNSISKVRDIFINIQDLEDICDIGLIRMVFFYWFIVWDSDNWTYITKFFTFIEISKDSL